MPIMQSRLRAVAGSVLAALLAFTAPALAQEGGPGLDDAGIAHIAVTANAIDAELAEVARARAVDERVRQFAATMIADHTAVNEQAAALAERLGVTPADNAVSRSLRAEADLVAERLGALSGAAFDRAYMEREVAYHRTVLEALDETLIPNTSNGELKRLLEQARGAVAAHLERAQAIRTALAASR